MSFALYRKELRGLLPLLLLVLLVFGADVLYEPLTSRLDDKAWATGSVEPGEGGDVAFVLLVLGLMASFSLLPREHDDRTIEFLHSLPISRTGIFLSKAAAGYSVLVLGIASGTFTSWLLQLPNEQTFTGEQFRWRTALGAAALQAAFALAIFCHGLFLSFFRRFGLVVYGIAAWCVILAKELSPENAFLDPTRLVSLSFEGTELAFPLRELAVQGVIAALAFLAAWFLWTGPAERVAAWFADAAASLGGRLALGCGTATIVALGLAMFVYWGVKQGAGGDEKPDEPFGPKVRWEPFNNVTAETEHFRFTYPANLRERSIAIVQSADRCYERVRGLLGAAAGNPIVVDMTERSSDHAGIASWQKMRMDLTSHDEDVDAEVWFRHVFVHELTHAFELQESSRRISDHARATGFFTEGLAEWVAHRLEPMPAKLAGARRLAFAATRRLRIRFDDLIDRDRFQAQHDGNLVYVVGESWCAGLARAHGDEAPGNLLRSMARKEAPRDLEPLELWQDTLQAAGYDLERVLASWKDVLAEVEAASPGFLDGLPRLAGGVARRKGSAVTFRASFDAPPPASARYLLRLRDGPHVAESQISTYRGEARTGGTQTDVEFSVPAARFNGRTFEFQFGVALEDASFPWFEDWQQGSSR